MTFTLTPARNPAIRVFGDAHLRTDGDLYSVVFAKDGSLWSLETSGLLRHWSDNGDPLEVRPLSDLETEWAFSSDVRVLASGSKELSLWDTSSGQILTSIRQDSWITALSLNVEPGFVATGHDDGSIRYWDLSSHSALKTLERHEMPISALALHADGKTLAAASEDCTISLWDLENGKLLGTLTGHTDRIPALAWHPTKHVLISAGWDATARVWDAHKGEPIILLNNHASQVTTVAVSPDGKWLATADSGSKVFLWDFASYTLARTLAGPTVEVRSLAFSPNSKTLAATGDRAIHLWNAATGEPIAQSDARSRVKPTVSVSLDGARIAANGGGLDCKVWDVAAWKALHVLRSDGQIHQVAFSSAGSLLAAACGEYVRVWDADTGQHLRDLDGPEEPLSHLAFSPDGAVLAAGGYTSTAVWLWSVATGEPLLIIPDPLEGCSPLGLAFHPQGKLLGVAGVDWLATGGSSGALSLWDLSARSETATLPDGSTCLAFDPLGKCLAASTLDRSIGIYDAATLDLRNELLGHDDAINCLAFSHDGKLLASGSDDQTIRLWNADGDEVALYEVESKVTSLGFSPDGQFLFAAHGNTLCSQFAVNVR